MPREDRAHQSVANTPWVMPALYVVTIHLPGVLDARYRSWVHPALFAELKQEGLTSWFWFSFPSLSRNGASHTHSWGPYERVSRFWAAWCIGIREKRKVSSKKLFWVMEMTLGNFQALTWVLFLEVSRVCGLKLELRLETPDFAWKFPASSICSGGSNEQVSQVWGSVVWLADSGWWNPAGLCAVVHSCPQHPPHFSSWLSSVEQDGITKIQFCKLYCVVWPQCALGEGSAEYLHIGEEVDG